jgi:hypothetical protein
MSLPLPKADRSGTTLLAHVPPERLEEVVQR